MSDDPTFRVADHVLVDETLARLARQVHAALGPRLRIMGIRRRGVPLARRLAKHLETITGAAHPVDEVTLKRYSDDLDLLHEQPRLTDEEDGPGVEGAHVLLVDDVLYSGRTLLRAVEYVVAGGAAQVHAVVLCSRGPNEVPVEAAFVGMQLDVAEDAVVEVRVPPYEEETAVDVRRLSS